jgi:hypothetical protein
MKKVLGFLVVVVVSLSLLPVAHGITISMSVPGTNANSSSTSPGAFIANFYQFALMIGGALAFAVIIYGGVKYMTSSGNPSGQSDAKEWIEAALLGILLLVGAYFILSVINPQLLNLGLPFIPSFNGGGTGSGPGNCSATICTGNTTSPGVPDGTEPQGSGGCPSTNACGANGGVCAGDCPTAGYICAATGGTANNTGAGTLPWHCIIDTASTH